jgi:hypothetical protein
MVCAWSAGATQVASVVASAGADIKKETKIALAKQGLRDRPWESDLPKNVPFKEGVPVDPQPASRVVRPVLALRASAA